MMADSYTYALLVPCYNSEQYLNSFLNTLKNQAKLFDEIIFYDDASTDNTVQMLESLGYNVIKGETNLGPSFARNQLIDATNCDWVHFHDPDDYMDNQYLLKVSEIAAQNKYDVILCNVDWLDSETGKVVISWKYSNEKISQETLSYTIQNPIGGINGLYNKQKLLTIGGFDTSLRIWEDADLHFRLALANHNFFVVEETLCFSMRRPNSASSNQGRGWLYRYQCLLNYYNLGIQKPTLTAIGLEAEKTGSYLIIYNLIAEAKEAFSLAIKCEIPFPSNNSKFIRGLSQLLPSFFLINLRVIQLRIAFKKH